MGTKKCSFCAEDIQTEAVKCRYCHSEINERKSGYPKQLKQFSATRMLICFGLLTIAIIGIIYLFASYRSNLEEVKKSQRDTAKTLNDSLATIQNSKRVWKKYCEAIDTKSQSSDCTSINSAILTNENQSKNMVEKFYLRIAFFNDSKDKPINSKCRMWIRGFGDFYPTRQNDWKYSGALIEKAGPFDIEGENVIYFYPDYPDESNEMKVPFKYSPEMNSQGSVRDMITISIETDRVVFNGVPIANANGKQTVQFIFNDMKIKK